MIRILDGTEGGGKPLREQDIRTIMSFLNEETKDRRQATMKDAM
jgi:hypothetical protein